MSAEQGIFILAAVITLGSAVMVVSTRSILHAAFWLVASLFGVAMLYALLQASFFTVIQVMVYIGAICILVIFGVMLTRHAAREDEPQLNRGWWMAGILTAASFVGLVFLLNSWQHFWMTPASYNSPDATLSQFGTALVSLSGYLLPFEVASMLLLAALIGAIFVALQRRESSPSAAPQEKKP